MDLRDTPEEINRIETYAAIPTDDQISEKLPGLLERASWWDRLMLDTWIPEFTGIIVCSLCLGGIIGLLLTYDNEPLPKFTRGITLNAVVSVLSTASRSLLIFVVAASVGQLKWCWYGPRKRNLHDIQTFDEASRGPLGSVKMLATLRAPLASVAAVITIAALAFDPSLQQLLSYPTRQVSAMEIPRLSSSLGFMYGAGDTRWANAISAGIWQPADRFAQQPTCPTAECNWPVYHSIGWCAKCEDAMSYAKLVNCTFGRNWPIKADALNGTDACTLDLGQGNKPQILQPHYNIVRGDPGEPGNLSPNPSMSRETLWVLNAMSSSSSSSPITTYLGVRNPVLALGHANVRVCNGVNDTTLNPKSVCAWRPRKHAYLASAKGN